MGPDPHLAGSSCEANTSVNAARAQASSALDSEPQFPLQYLVLSLAFFSPSKALTFLS